MPPSKFAQLINRKEFKVFLGALGIVVILIAVSLSSWITFKRDISSRSSEFCDSFGISDQIAIDDLMNDAKKLRIAVEFKNYDGTTTLPRGEAELLEDGFQIQFIGPQDKAKASCSIKVQSGVIADIF